MADLVAGDTASAIRATLRRGNGLPFDLTGLTAIIKFRCNNDAMSVRTLDVLNAVGGLVQYTFGFGELKAGKLYVEFEIISPMFSS